MIEGKAALLASWLVLLVACCGLPFSLLIPRVATSATMRLAPVALGWILVLGGATLLYFRGMPSATSPLTLSLPFIAPSLGVQAAAALGGLPALPLLATVAWWAPKLSLEAWPSLSFLAAGISSAVLPVLNFRNTGLPLAPTLVALLGFGIVATLLMGQFGSPALFWAVWHHWGAYAAPAQAMLAGGVPFRDFPVQYGMGPTLLIAALSSKDLFFGIYLATAIVNTLYLLALCACVLLVLRESPRGVALLATLALTCAVLLWTGYPPNEAGPMMTPSVDGMRFLPLALLILAILWGERRARPVTSLGYMVWLLSLAWSPEVGVYATIVWFPYLGLRTAQKRGVATLGGVVWIVLREAALALAASATGIAVLTFLFRAAFGDLPSVSGFLTYILNPPGILPPNPLGPVWLALAALGIGAVALTRADARGLRTVTVCLLGFVAVSSYYLGRSHDNNVLNLFPFMVLLLCSALSMQLPSMLDGFSRLALVGIVAWPATFGFQSLTAAVQSGEGLAIGPARLLDRFRLATPDSWALLDAALSAQSIRHSDSADAGAALAWLAQQGAGPPLVINQARIVPRDVAGPAWTGVNNLANFDLLPREVVIKFVQQGAATFHRPGWLLVDRMEPGDWLDRFGSAYQVAAERAFGGYTAYQLVPK